MADTSLAENGSNNVKKSDTFEVPSVYHGLSGLKNKDNTENPESVSSNQVKIGENMTFKNGQYIFQTETDGKTDESNGTGFLKSVNKVVIPKDLSLYPGFPDTEGMSKEDSDTAIITFWRFWRKHKYKQKEKAKKLAKRNEQRAAQGLGPLENHDDDPDPGFKPPGYPDTEGLEENEAKEKIKQFWTSWRQDKDKAKEMVKDTTIYNSKRKKRVAEAKLRSQERRSQG